MGSAHSGSTPFTFKEKFMRPCPKCGGERTTAHSYCTPCRRAYERGRPRVRDREERRRANAKYRYDVTPEQYASVFEAQGGRCAICLTPASDLRVRLNIDHDHSTGRFRGLLCGNCNRALGLLKDDPKCLDRARAYLMREEINDGRS